MSSWQKPTDKQIARAVALLTRPQLMRKFFRELNNPEWAAPLEKKGFFNMPAQPIRNEKEGTIQFIGWPQSGYLARIAKDAPDVVASILGRIETDNVAIHMDILDAALAMPPDQAAKLAAKETAWARKQRFLHLLFSDKSIELAIQLANAGRRAESLGLIQEVLSPRPDASKPDEESPKDPDESFKINHFDFEEALEKVTGPIAAKIGTELLRFLCSLLDSVVTKVAPSEFNDRLNDNSHIWSDAIGEDLRRSDIRGYIVRGIFRCASEIASTDSTSVHPILTELLSNKKVIFYRLALKLAQEFPDKEFVKKLLFDKSSLEDYRIQDEYSDLLESQLKDLDTEDLETLIEWINQGPDIDRFIEARKSWDKEPSEKQILEYVESWKQNWLSIVQPRLNVKDRTQLTELNEKYGETTERQTRHKVTTSWAGPTTPWSKEKILKEGPEKTLEFMHTWEPKAGIMVDSREGLARALADAIPDAISEFSAITKKVIEVRPIYVRHFLMGLGKALKSEMKLDWPSFFTLGKAIIKKPYQVESGQNNQAEQGWEDVRKELGSVLEECFTSKHSLPIDFRKDAWEILENLCDDKNPTRELEKSWKSDAATLSINTPRGVAFNTAVQYGLWVRRWAEKEPNADELLGMGFDLFPELRTTLEKHLDPAIDDTHSVRAAYGRWFPWLALFDEDWATRNKPEIFPSDPTFRDLYNAAWETYIAFCPAYNTPFKILREEYNRHAKELRAGESKRASVRDINEAFAEHLATLVWRGALKISPLDPILESFYANASAELKAKVLGHPGFALKGSVGKEPPQLIKNLQDLFEFRLSQVQSDADGKKEISEFGWWLGSKAFPKDWLFRQLKKALDITGGNLEVVHLAGKTLAESSDVYPVECIEAAEAIVSGQDHGWRVLSWREELKNLLRTVLRSNSPKAKKKAEALVHRLGAMGFDQFGDVLRDNGLLG